MFHELICHILAYYCGKSSKCCDQQQAGAGTLPRFLKSGVREHFLVSYNNWLPVNGRAKCYSLLNLPNMSTKASQWPSRKFILSLGDRKFSSMACIRYVEAELYDVFAALKMCHIISNWIVCIVVPLFINHLFLFSSVDFFSHVSVFLFNQIQNFRHIALAVYCIYLFRPHFPFTFEQHKWINNRKLPFCISIASWITNTWGISSFRWRPSHWRSEWSWHKLSGWGSEVILQRLGEPTLPQGTLPGLHLHH